MNSQSPETAANLYHNGLISLSKTTEISGLSISEFIQYLGELGIDVVRHDETVNQEVKDMSQWLSS